MARLRPYERDIGVIGAPVRSGSILLGVFCVVFLGLALCERIGLGIGWLPVGVIGSSLALFALVALAAHGRRASDYYLADRSIRPAILGMASAAFIAGLVVIG